MWFSVVGETPERERNLHKCMHVKLYTDLLKRYFESLCVYNYIYIVQYFDLFLLVPDNYTGQRLSLTRLQSSMYTWWSLLNNKTSEPFWQTWSTWWQAQVFSEIGWGNEVPLFGQYFFWETMKMKKLWSGNKSRLFSQYVIASSKSSAFCNPQ